MYTLINVYCTLDKYHTTHKTMHLATCTLCNGDTGQTTVVKYLVNL